MKKIYLLISLTILFLSGCANPYTTIDEQNKKIDELNKKIENNNLDLQEKCSENAQIFFDYFENDSQTKQRDGQSNHYNTKLNKCFVLIKHYDETNGIYSENFYDAIEKKSYGSYASNITEEGKKYWEIKPLICEMLDEFCQTKDEFDNFTKSYMEE